MKAILVFGDSIVFGRGDNKGWVDRLKEEFQALDFYNAVYNLGLPGETTTTLLERFELECKARIVKKRPEDKFSIIIGIGVNDTRGIGSPDNLLTSQDKFKANIQQLIDISKKYTDSIIFLSMIKVDESITNPYEDTYFTNERISEYNTIIKNLCDKTNLPYIDIFKDYDLADGLHPSAEGYKDMHRDIKNAIDARIN